MEHKDIIIGAGLAGLTAGIKTGAPIYEAKTVAGGLCRDNWYNKYCFCNGGPHFFFGSGRGLEFVESYVRLVKYERKASVYFNKFFPYPFQTAAQQENKYTEGTLKAWLANNFSLAECNLFFNPFNEKHTAGLYDEIIQTDEFKTPKAGGQGFVANFYEPENGLSYFIDTLCRKQSIPISYKKIATKVDWQNKIVFFEDGSNISYKRLISTIPLSLLLTLCGRSDFDLPHSSVAVINLGATRGFYLPTDHWIYIPFSDSGMHRVCIYSNVDKNKAPSRYFTSISVEVAYRGKIDPEEVTAKVISELRKWQFIKSVMKRRTDLIEYAYTWTRSKDHVQDCLNWLKERDIISIGRYGKWKFQGMLQSIEDGLDV